MERLCRGRNSCGNRRNRFLPKISDQESDDDIASINSKDNDDDADDDDD